MNAKKISDEEMKNLTSENLLGEKNMKEEVPGEVVSLNNMSSSDVKKATAEAKQQANLLNRLDKEQERLDKEQRRQEKRFEERQRKLDERIEKAKAPRKRHGDRKDGKRLRDLDSMHMIMPILYPNRCDNEAYIDEVIDFTKTNEYIKARNDSTEGMRLSAFDIVVAAVLKTIMLRPKMNRFIVSGSTYQRNEISASFVVKKHFNDEGEEGLAIIKAEESDTLDSIYAKITEQISIIRKSDIKDASSEMMDKFTSKLPGFLLKLAVGFVKILDKCGKVPQSFIETDPYYSSVVLTYLGSIKMHSCYHHLTNWGTNSFFVSVGEKKLRPFYDRHGSMTMRDSLDVALTIDERLADGYYYSKTVRLFKKLVENPELLEMPFGEKVDY